MKKHEQAQIVNTKTGEIKDGYFIYVAQPKSKIRNERWMMTFQDSLITIAKDKDLTGEMKSVLFFLMGNLEFDNYITIKQVEIAKQLEMQKTNVSRAMRLLVSKSIILKVKDGSTTGYKLNPNYGWKGRVENREIEKAKIIDLRHRELDDEFESSKLSEPQYRPIGEPDYVVPEDEIPY